MSVQEKIAYHSNGIVFKRAVVVDGVRHGKYEEFYDNNQQRIKTTYVNDKLHGKYEQWYFNGQKWIDCTYANDERV